MQNPVGLNIFISNQFIQYNTLFNHTNIRIRTEAKAYQVLLENDYNKPNSCIDSLFFETCFLARS